MTSLNRAVYEDSFLTLRVGWVSGLADVVGSTAAIAEGRYKAVNLAGAAVISALANVFGTLDFPYVFTGDGMACAVPPQEADRLGRTLTMTVGWIMQSLDLDMRVAVVPLSTIREAGADVRVARFAPSPHVSYAMFSGGGLAWADEALKAGRLPLLTLEGGRPDLSGLTCRFQPIPSRRGVIVSLVVTPTGTRRDARFTALIDDLIGMAASLNPVPVGGPAWSWPPAGLEHEARLHRRICAPLIASRLAVAGRTLGAARVVRGRLTVGGFRPAPDRAQRAENSDFRKFGDSLMMTVDCSREEADRLEARLASAVAEHVADYGMHRQDAALMTCLVPAPEQDGHVHFIDGAGGGYTVAAGALKRARADRLRAATV